MTTPTERVHNVTAAELAVGDRVWADAGDGWWGPPVSQVDTCAGRVAYRTGNGGRRDLDAATPITVLRPMDGPPTFPVPVSYTECHTIANALEARAQWMDEGVGDEGPRLAASARYRALAHRFNSAALSLLNTYPVDLVRARDART